MRIARDAGVKNVFDLDVDPAYFVSAGLGSEADLAEAMRLTDILKPCKPAARDMTGASDPAEMAQKLLAMGPKIVALTAGSDGCVIASAAGLVERPSYKVKVVDTTGAGDAFMGGLSFALLQGWPHERVADFANACAALCCTAVGARAMARRAEVEALMSQSGAGGAHV